MNAMTLYAMTEEYVEARRSLEAMADAGDIDSAALADTLDAIRAPVEVKAVNVAAYDSHLLGQVGVIDAEIVRLQRYKASLQRQSEALRNYLHDQMVRAGITKIEAVAGAPPFRLSIRKNPPRVVVDHESEIPWEFKRERTVVDIDKTAIRDALKAGDSVPGAHIEQSERVDIR